MPSRWKISWAVLALALVPAPVRSADTPAKGPTMVARLKSLDGLIEDFKYLAKLSGVENEAQQGEDFFRAFLGDKGSEVIDPTRPIGMYGTVKPDFMNSTAVVLLPVVQDKLFLDFLDRFAITAKKGDDGIYTLSTDNFPVPVPVYLRFANKYAYVTAQNKGDLTQAQLPDPAQVLAGTRDALASLTIHLDRIPEGLKHFALGGLDLRMAEEQNKKFPGETKAQEELRKESIKDLTKQAASLIKEGGKIEAFVEVDRKANEVVAELDLAGTSGSKLAAGISELGQAKSLFAALPGNDTVLDVLVHVVAPENVRKALEPVIDEGLRKALAQEKDEGKRAVAEKFLKALDPTFKGGELDAGVVLRGPNAEHHYTLVAGVKLKNGKAVEQTVQDVVKSLPERDRSVIKLNAESAAGTNIHRLDVQQAYEEGFRQTVGNNPVYVAIRPDALLVAAGPDALKAVKQALAAQPATGALVQVDAALGRLPPALSHVIAQNHKEGGAYIEKAAKESFGPNAKGSDQVRLVVEGGQTLRVRYTVKAPVLKFFGQIAPRAARGAE
jgi:RNA binding exosome subunit